MGVAVFFGSFSSDVRRNEQYFGSFQKEHLSDTKENLKNLRLIEIKAVYLQSNMNTMQYVMIFVSSCVEAAAKKVGCSTGEMYRRMKRVGLISGFIIPGYEALHTQSREHVTEDVLGALHIWEEKQGVAV